jgi:hypothetical protein
MCTNSETARFSDAFILMADINKKKAPQRLVKEINRVGNWGRVEYHHVLECGHTEIRKRTAPADKVACSSCALASQMQEHTKEVSITARDGRIIEGIDAADIIGTESYHLSSEINVSRAQSALSAHLGIPREAVDVVSEIDENGVLKITYAVIFVDASQIELIIRSAYGG